MPCKSSGSCPTVKARQGQVKSGARAPSSLSSAISAFQEGPRCRREKVQVPFGTGRFPLRLLGGERKHPVFRDVLQS